MSLADELKELDSTAMLEMGQRIKDARREAGISATDLAGVLGVSSSHMSKIENGWKTCTTENLYKLGQVLKTSADYLIYGDTKSRMEQEIMNELSGLDEYGLEDVLDMIRIMKRNRGRRACA